MYCICVAMNVALYVCMFVATVYVCMYVAIYA